MGKEVYKSSEFSAYAKKNLVLVKVDFPKPNTLPADQQKANDALLEKYSVEGFPTVILTDATGKELWREVGYDGKGSKAFLKKVEKNRKK